jgi:hypothetical protein
MDPLMCDCTSECELLSPRMTAHRLYLILITPTASSDSNSTFVTS